MCAGLPAFGALLPYRDGEEWPQKVRYDPFAQLSGNARNSQSVPPMAASLRAPNLPDPCRPGVRSSAT